ncbi:MAG TPA: hypothetical protein VKE74_20590 [Gemmataceae bacterium]|nr:hypothetical protein [Gemmataceae bacterium]
MSDRDNQERLDRLAMRYLAAIDSGDFDAIDALWDQSEADPELGEMLHGLHAALVEDQDAQDAAGATAMIEAAIEKHLPSAEVIRPATGPLTVAEVAEHIRKNPPRGLTTDDLKLNDVLRASAEVVPSDLGIGPVAGWGRRFGMAPEAYWRAFREVALKLRMQRESAENYQMAARPARPKPTEGKP